MKLDEIVESQLKVLTEKLINKTVGKELAKSAQGKLSLIRQIITLNSLLTHAMIEYEKDQKYMLSVIYLHTQVTDLLKQEVERKKD